VFFHFRAAASGGWLGDLAAGQVTVAAGQQSTIRIVVTADGGTLDWGDGTTDTLINTGNGLRSHTYTNAGTYDVVYQNALGITSEWDIYGANLSPDADIDTWIYQHITRLPGWVGSANESTFRETDNLTEVLIESPFTSTGRWTSMCFQARGLEKITLPADCSGITHATNAFSTATALTEILGNADVSGIVTAINMFGGGASSAPPLTKIELNGLSISHSLRYTAMTQAALVDWFGRLGTPSGAAQEVDVRNTPGGGSLTAPELAIATSKNWTVRQ